MVYAWLFASDPSLRSLGNSDLYAQGRKLMTVLRVVATGLSRQDTVVPAVEAPGRRHIGDGVSDEHDATVDAALLE